MNSWDSQDLSDDLNERNDEISETEKEGGTPIRATSVTVHAIKATLWDVTEVLSPLIFPDGAHKVERQEVLIHYHLVLLYYSKLHPLSNSLPNHIHTLLAVANYLHLRIHKILQYYYQLGIDYI